VAFSPDGQQIVTGSRDTTAKLWMAATGEQLSTCQKEEMKAQERVAVLLAPSSKSEKFSRPIK
jgi:WD40 repeat protein